jgi:hypothetical protein
VAICIILTVGLITTIEIRRKYFGNMAIVRIWTGRFSYLWSVSFALNRFGGLDRNDHNWELLVDQRIMFSRASWNSKTDCWKRLLPMWNLSNTIAARGLRQLIWPKAKRNKLMSSTDGCEGRLRISDRVRDEAKVSAIEDRIEKITRKGGHVSENLDKIRGKTGKTEPECWYIEKIEFHRIWLPSFIT